MAPAFAIPLAIATYVARVVALVMMCKWWGVELLDTSVHGASGAATFVIVKSYEWFTEISHGFTITSSPFWSFYYTAAGIHALHVIGGAIIMLFVAHKAKKNMELHRVELIGIYWHFVDLVWIFLFPLLYIAK